MFLQAPAMLWTVAAVTLLAVAAGRARAGGPLVPVAGAVTDDRRVDHPLVFDTLQSSPDRVDRVSAAGVDLVTMEVYWDRRVRGRCA